MNDRYICRAKRSDNGEWIEGSLITGVFLRGGQDIPYILCQEKADCDCFEDLTEGNGIFEVDPNTICQCTGESGLCEHDIFHLGDAKILYEVVWNDTGFRGKQIKSSSYVGLKYWNDRIVTVGNSFDNPELLEV